MQNNFHFIRFIAASFVLFGHCYPLTGKGNNDYLTVLSKGIFPTAHMGVCIFFIVSGYLVSQSLKNSTTIGNFIWKRVLRIFPALIVVLLLSIFILGPICTTLPLSTYWASANTYQYFGLIILYPTAYIPHTLPGTFANLPINEINGSLWTLPYEITMYLFLVFLQIINLFSKRNVILILFIITTPLTIYLALYHNRTLQIPILNLSFFDLIEFGIFFMLGSIMCLFKDKISYRFGYFVLMLFLWFGLGFLHITTPNMIKSISFFALPYIVLYLANLKGKLNDFGKLGDFSYGIYIYAFPVQQMVVHFYGTNISIEKIFLLSYSIVLFLSILSWFFIEEKALRFKSKSILWEKAY